ncbi:polysaccharide deacetylase family protein [Ilumatobacter coccineus]|uniref:Putative hydrolase n=1 Tax=Ilumatobacter coccineus (strain NBRC 103263 / KCTC 29153 / YM16-304) TaxID=1313172 RepID=A0A6C7EE82_ILUCY|nr:polysaccharide deacetylase family protein [Ilumatobacter coccineus]BAN04272.1 putative hydrolase [Ilumatobacter coccineus YM16-304]
MPAERRPGYDHEWFDYSALADRRRPGSGVAVVPIILLELYEDPLPEGWPQPSSTAGGLDRAFPNISRVSMREYGHRVGIFRLLDALERHGVRPTIAIDAMTAEGYPWLVQRLVDAGADWIAHGISVTRPIGSHLTAEEERAYVTETIERLAACGIETNGWLGPEYGESERTPGVLAAAGMEYVFDWTGDEQFVDFHVDTGRLTGFPLSADLDDQTTLANRMAEPAAYGQHLVDAATELAIDDGRGARVLSFCVRPWLTGQPFRVGVFDHFVDAVVDIDGATLTHWTDAAASLQTEPLQKATTR